MKQLSNEFDGRADQKGYAFNIVNRQGMVCLLEKVHKESGRKFWEVVLLLQRPETLWPTGKVTEARETLPSPEEWVSSGWSAPSLERAEEIFKRECEHVR